jgi:acyl-coenzyme A synthetase/AMP-(fatty) acid ligase
VAEFPQTPSGKIQKFVLRDQIAAHQIVPSRNGPGRRSAG